MSTTAQSLIESAYARSSSNDAGKLAVDGELLAHLNRKYQHYYALMVANGEDNGLARTALAALAGSPPTVALPTDVIDIRRIETSGGSKVNLIPADEKARSWHLAPCVYRLGNSLVSRGLAGDPVAGEALTLYHLDSPAQLTALSDTLDARFPVRFEELLVLELAAYLAVKDEGRNATEVQAIQQERKDALDMFMFLTKNSNTARESAHQGRNQANSAN